MTTMAFRVVDLVFAYPGRRPALDGVSLDVALGERVVILGANGCGKSTLLKLMDGLIKPVSGTVEALGRDAARAVADPDFARDLHRQVGLVFQDSDVQLFSPTVWDDVAFGPLQMGWDPADVRQAVETALAQMEIEGLARRAPYELSEGEKKRASIATVLALDPEVLLLDEPTASLDPRSKALLLDLLERLGQSGKTVIATTQELEVAPWLGNRAIVLGQRERRALADGPIEDLLADEALLVDANLIHPRLHRGWSRPARATASDGMGHGR